ncbi:hypothetical protein SUGI_0136600 [Cryptomeria japonica]|nr:hypothetical protein SUGI_0136600 [Cryptomeria japonica]
MRIWQPRGVLVMLLLYLKEVEEKVLMVKAPHVQRREDSEFEQLKEKVEGFVCSLQLLVSMSRDRKGVSCMEKSSGPPMNSLDRNGRFASTVAEAEGDKCMEWSEAMGRHYPRKPFFFWQQLWRGFPGGTKGSIEEMLDCADDQSTILPTMAGGKFEHKKVETQDDFEASAKPTVEDDGGVILTKKPPLYVMDQVKIDPINKIVLLGIERFCAEVQQILATHAVLDSLTQEFQLARTVYDYKKAANSEQVQRLQFMEKVTNEAELEELIEGE